MLQHPLQVPQPTRVGNDLAWRVILAVQLIHSDLGEAGRYMRDTPEQVELVEI